MMRHLSNNTFRIKSNQILTFFNIPFTNMGSIDPTRLAKSLLYLFI